MAKGIHNLKKKKEDAEQEGTKDEENIKEERYTIRNG